MSLWGWLWVAWGAAFAVIEGVAIWRDREKDGVRTLSDHLVKWFSTKQKRGRTVWLVVSGCFFAWFVVHIAVPGSV